MVLRTDSIASTDCAQALRHHQDRLGSTQRIDRFSESRFGRAVERGSRLVEHQQIRIMIKRAGDAEPLALSAGETDAALAYRGVQSFR